MAEPTRLHKEGKVEHKLENFKDDVTQLRSDITDFTRKLIDLGKNEATHVKDNIFENGKRITELMQDKLKERPLITLLGAFAVGLLFGGVLRRRRHHRD